MFLLDKYAQNRVTSNIVSDVFVNLPIRGGSQFTFTAMGGGGVKNVRKFVNESLSKCKPGGEGGSKKTKNL